MKFAFSTAVCPAWDLSEVTRRAKEFGYDGVEIRGFLNDPSATASNVFQTEPAKVRETFASAGVAVACLASSAGYDPKRSAAQARSAADEIVQYLRTAGAVGCPLVKVSAPIVEAGPARAAVGIAFAEWLLPLADVAADNRVTLVVDNGRSGRSAKELWAVMERVNHPAVGVCWDVAGAALAGEQPATSVPVLNSRIQYAQVADFKVDGTRAVPTALGDGEVAVRKFLIRLMGVGYAGYVTVGADAALIPQPAEPEQFLPGALAKLREWTKPQAAAPAAKSDAAPAAPKKPAAATPPKAGAAQAAPAAPAATNATT